MNEPDGTNMLDMTEPTIIPSPFVSGMIAVMAGQNMSFVGWVDIPDLGGQAKERRAQVRFTMPIEAVRECHKKVGEMLKRASHNAGHGFAIVMLLT